MKRKFRNPTLTTPHDTSNDVNFFPITQHQFWHTLQQKIKCGVTGAFEEPNKISSDPKPASMRKLIYFLIVTANEKAYKFTFAKKLKRYIGVHLWRTSI